MEANQLLGMFDASLREYAARSLVKSGVHLVKGVVEEVREREIKLKVRRGAGWECWGRQGTICAQARLSDACCEYS